MNRLFLMVGLAIMIAALAFLNQGIKKASPTDKDLEQQQQQAQQEAQKKAEEAQETGGACCAGPAFRRHGCLAVRGNDRQSGDSAASHSSRLGVRRGKPSQPAILTGPLQVIRDYVNSSKGTVSAEIVNLDIPAEDRSPAAQPVADLGISVDGNPVMPGNFSEMHVTAPDITKALDTAMVKK